MLRDADVQIVRHSDVESARAAGNDVPNTSCGPSRFNLLPSKLCHLEQSTDSNPVISANGASWSSPRDVDASDRIEKNALPGDS
jgi:hypothetical protein